VSPTDSPPIDRTAFSWFERISFWLLMAALCLAAGVGAAVIAASVYHPPWSSAWFIAGIVIGGLGIAAGLWALVLYLARRIAKDDLCPDPQAHAARAQEPPSGEFGRAWPVRAVAAGAIAEAPPGTRLRAVMREIAADLKQTAAALVKAQKDNSYADMDYVLNVPERWKENLPMLAELISPEPYNQMRDACAHIEGLCRVIRGSSSKPGASRPQPSHGLDAALSAVRAAQAAINAELP
jgi:hypothetical protein